MTPAYRNPVPTVDIIIELNEGVVLIERKNPPYGWALPGGFVDYGESVEAAARREALEETSLDVKLTAQLHVYSDPKRDERLHTVTTVFVAKAREEAEPAAGDDAKRTAVYKEENLPAPLAFDHERILGDYFRWKREGYSVFSMASTSDND